MQSSGMEQRLKHRACWWPQVLPMCAVGPRGRVEMARRTAAGERLNGLNGLAGQGFALVMVLLAMALISLAASVPLRNQQHAMQRDRETELLFIGEQFRQAIASYAAASPGGVPQYPPTLADLLEDKRFPFVKRHLRRLYADPMTGRPDWELIRDQGAVIGVASRSARTPLKRSQFSLADSEFAAATTYADWKFVRPVVAASAPAPEPPDDKRNACGRTYSAALNRCARDPPRALVCRQQARVVFLACLRG
jgi:type II secretory pathway pseudopilin PulG